MQSRPSTLRSEARCTGAQEAHAAPAASSAQPKITDSAPMASRSAFRRPRVTQASVMMLGQRAEAVPVLDLLRTSASDDSIRPMLLRMGYGHLWSARQLAF